MIKVIETWSHPYVDAILVKKIVKFLGITIYCRERIVPSPSENEKAQE
ncbi:hypothetical protein [Bergeyella zoohelcum]|uniref:Uncharacterized protein n=1 Tax=Bergeyella zoohelcum TaxID=1015 RepID=A0A380ZWM9_9FLAO|nr:hypothetical protein [Bergeyella zoohelcum]EKB58373.1 hypothetical protein HMPREF9700_01825 [Bergeyella zoohelcum CCUG 30536]SUV53166.1 Uncharacterised protein [Bergeyella zoohelcum]